MTEAKLTIGHIAEAAGTGCPIIERLETELV
jgi:hypothetical protein